MSCWIQANWLNARDNCFNHLIYGWSAGLCECECVYDIVIQMWLEYIFKCSSARIIFFIVRSHHHLRQSIGVAEDVKRQIVPPSLFCIRDKNTSAIYLIRWHHTSIWASLIKQKFALYLRLSSSFPQFLRERERLRPMNTPNPNMMQYTQFPLQHKSTRKKLYVQNVQNYMRK